MSNNLFFNQTRSVKKFKDDNNIKKINVIKNPHTDKLFFVSPCNSKIAGKVAKRLDSTMPVFVSEVTDEQSGETFFMLHNREEVRKKLIKEGIPESYESISNKTVFKNTISTDDYMIRYNIKHLEIIEMPITSKLLFRSPCDEKIKGLVIENIDMEKEKVISYCIDIVNSISFHLLHNSELLRTIDLDVFKQEMNISKIEIREEPYTNNKFFFSPDNSSINGRVDKSFDNACEASITKQIDKDSACFVLHDRYSVNIDVEIDELHEDYIPDFESNPWEVNKNISIKDFVMNHGVTFISKVRKNVNGYSYLTLLSKDFDGGAENIYFSKKLGADVKEGTLPQDLDLKSKFIATIKNAAGEERLEISSADEATINQPIVETNPNENDDVVFITEFNQTRIVSSVNTNNILIDRNKIEFDFNWFNNTEIKQILKYLLFYENPILYIKKYKEHISTDTFTLVYEGSRPSYHKRSDCLLMASDYINFKIPQVIKDRGNEAVIEFRNWFKENYEEHDDDRFFINLCLRYKLKENPFKVKVQNRRKIADFDNRSKIQIRESINKIIAASIEYYNSNSTIKEIINEYGYVAFIYKKEEENFGKVDIENVIVKEVLKKFDTDFKSPLKSEIQKSYKIGSKNNLDNNVLESLGFSPCRRCYSDDYQTLYSLRKQDLSTKNSTIKEEINDDLPF